MDAEGRGVRRSCCMKVDLPTPLAPMIAMLMGSMSCLACSNWGPCSVSQSSLGLQPVRVRLPCPSVSSRGHSTGSAQDRKNGVCVPKESDSYGSEILSGAGSTIAAVHGRGDRHPSSGRVARRGRGRAQQQQQAEARARTRGRARSRGRGRRNEGKTGRRGWKRTSLWCLGREGRRGAERCLRSPRRRGGVRMADRSLARLRSSLWQGQQGQQLLQLLQQNDAAG